MYANSSIARHSEHFPLSSRSLIHTLLLVTAAAVRAHEKRQTMTVITSQFPVQWMCVDVDIHGRRRSSQCSRHSASEPIAEERPSSYVALVRTSLDKSSITVTALSGRSYRDSVIILSFKRYQTGSINILVEKHSFRFFMIPPTTGCVVRDLGRKVRGDLSST